MSEKICGAQKGLEQPKLPEYLVFHNRETAAYSRSLAAWPLHITIAPPFQLGQPDALHRLRGILCDIAEDFTPFQVVPGQRALFGPDSDTPVTRLEDPSGQLHALHERVLWDLGSLGCEAIDGRYVLDNYNPHVTDKADRQLAPEPFVVDSLTLVRRIGAEKQMLETVALLA